MKYSKDLESELKKVDTNDVCIIVEFSAVVDVERILL